jgi:hypothetical protein
MTLKLVLISVDNTFASEGKMQGRIVKDLAALARDLDARGVRVALWSNKSWKLNDGTPIQEHISKIANVEIKIHGAGNDGCPPRRLKNSALPVIAKYGVSRHETVLLAGVNSGLLLIRPDWYAKQMDYGFSVPDVNELRRFLFVFGLREYPIFWQIRDGDVDVSASGPYSTMRPDYAEFGASARDVAKHGIGRRDFWFYLLVSSVYFGDLLQDINIICTYPSHGVGVRGQIKQEIDETLARLGKCFRKPYFYDLVIRHKAALKSQPIAAANRKLTTQLNSIHLNRHPHPNCSATPRKTALSLRGKVVLLVDDFCTSGRSLEAARAYIQAAGGAMRALAWLKTINTSYMGIIELPQLEPFQPNLLQNEPAVKAFPYAHAIVAPSAPSEIRQIYRDYVTWK